MPQPWEMKDTIVNPNVQPQPFPGQLPIGLDPTRAAAARKAAEQRAREDAQEARAASGEARANAREVRDAASFAMEHPNGRQKPTVDQGKALALASEMDPDLEAIAGIMKKYPDIRKPGRLETLGELGGSDFIRKFGAAQADPNGYRTVLNNRFGNFAQSAIYGTSGSAFTKEEIQNLVSSIKPDIFATDAVLQDQMKMLLNKVEGQYRRTNMPEEEIQQRIGQLRGKLDQLPFFGGNRAGEGGTPQLSGTTESVPVDPAYQKAHDQFLAQHPAGSLSVADYVKFRQGLDQSSGNAFSNYKDAENFVNAYNKGQATTTIPAGQRDLSGMGKMAASAAADKGLAGDLYAGGLGFANAIGVGVPKFLASENDRAALRAMEDQHWKSAFVGDLAGSMVPTTALGGLAGRTGMGILGRQIAGNAAYGGIRSGLESEGDLGDRAQSAALGAGIGGLGAVVGNALVKGAKGFQSPETIRDLERLGPQTYEMPAARGAMPVDDITPLRYQGMGDDLLRQEQEAAQRGLAAHREAVQTNAAREAQRAQIEQEIQATAAQNRNLQERYVRENFRSTQPDQLAAIRAEAETRFPTDPQLLRQGEGVGGRLEKAQPVDMTGMEDPSILQQRASRIEDYLGQSGVPSQLKTSGTSYTVPQQMGLGHAEEALNGIPGVQSGMRRAMESFNKENAQRILAPLGIVVPKGIKAGHELNGFVHDALGKAYGEISPQITGRQTAGFKAKIDALRAVAAKTETGRKLWPQIEDSLNKFRDPVTGEYSGEGYQQLSETMRGLKDDWALGKTDDQIANGPAYREMAKTASQIRQAARGLVAENNPALGARLSKLEKAYSQNMRITAAANRQGPLMDSGVYDPEAWLSEIKRLDTPNSSSRIKYDLAAGKALDQDYATSAQNVLGGRVPDKPSLKGTGAALGTGLMASHFGGPLVTIPAAAALGAAYLPGVKQGTKFLLKGPIGEGVDKLAVIMRGAGNSSTRNALAKGLDKEQLVRLLSQITRQEVSDKVEGK